MVGPDAHADKPDGDGCADHNRVAKYHFAGEDRNDFGGNSKSWKDKNINFGVTENPEEMHPENCRAAGHGVEEVAAEVTVDEQHELGCGERTDGQNHQARHNKIEPGEQWHPSQRHPWTAYAQNRSED